MGNSNSSNQENALGALDRDNNDDPFYMRECPKNKTLKHEGWLSKQTISKKMINTSRWKDRYFVVKRGVLIYYIVEDQQIYDLSQLDNVQVLNNNKPSVLNNDMLGYEFQLFFGNDNEIDSNENGAHNAHSANSAHELLNFATITKKDLDFIIGILCGYCASDDKLYDSVHIQDIFEKMSMELYYCTNKGAWVNYYCIIEEETLKLLRKNQRGMFSLLDATIENIDDTNFTFTLVKDNERLNLCAHNKDNFEAWIENLQLEIINASNLSGIHSTRDASQLSMVDLNYFNKLHDVLEKEDKVKNEKAKANTGMMNMMSGFVNNYRKKYFVILSIDGGGIRGILNTIILERILKKHPHFLDGIDMFTGTSNGGMTATGLAFGYSPTICRTFTELCSKTIFGETQSYTGLSKAKYSNKYLEILCQEIFKEKCLNDAEKHLVIPALSMKDKIEISIFHNLQGSTSKTEKASDVVMRTIAAPIYFPSYQGYVDGGMFAHDPSTIALTCAMSNLKIPPENIVMLSIGTGWVEHSYSSESNFDWGYKQWLPKLPTVLWDSMVLKSQWMCESLLKERFLRVNPILDSDIPLDDPHQISILTEIANDFDIEFIDEFIENYF